MNKEWLYEGRDFVEKYWKAILAVLIVAILGITMIIYQMELSDLKLNQELLAEDLQSQVTSDITTYLSGKVYGDNTGNDYNTGTITSDEADELAQQVADLLEKRITAAVMSGTEQLVVADLQDDIDKLVSEKFAEWDEQNIETLAQEVASIAFNDIKNTLIDLQTQQENLSNLYTTLNDTVDKLTNKVDNLETTITNLQAAYDSAIDSLKQKDINLQSQIDTLKDSTVSATDFNKEIKSTDSEISDLNNSLNALKKTVADNTNNNELFAALNESIEKVQTTLNNLSATTSANISTNKEEIEALKVKVDALNSTLQGNIDDLSETTTNSITNLTNNLNDLNDKVEAYNSEITSKLTEYSYNAESGKTTLTITTYNNK